ncbi:hypothetical protein COU87_02655 [Candidatus Roizmanbacteria bacterium CG10_big_fil_rev_8_21_14_0_10_39_12]|uniref:Fibronectin type-III domain-containing protein n=1 Tax=Candidatus Roizmanbacteria bacterium CG10_big_fil_rev_8_21_14_0_10_39_12 TaxID=1974852 RepID=A0A2M8KPF9_9BACT|nr:MAG: hypothetical protein COU87_02655 [Candidatus Roizmanbacteria bacterium CG10_big_fil_rev_8_21_14_0_10_39_12]
MQIATVQKKKISNKQLKTVGLFVGIGVLIAASIGIFFMIQGNPTEASEEAPQNVSIQTIDPNNARVSWETGKDTIAVVEYGTTADATSFSEFAFSEVETTSHDVNLSSLEPNTTYFFQIRVGSEVYDNGGSYWTLTTPPEEEIDVSISPDPSVSTSPSPESSITPTATISATIVPTPSIVASPSAVLTPTISGSPTPISTISATLTPQPGVTSAVCTSDNCTTILQSLGTSCTTQDYVRCLLGANVTTTPAATNTPTPTPLASSVKSSCAITSFQSNSCTSWIWEDMASKENSCSDVFTKYFVQCKSSSFTSSDPSTWYCNKTVTSNQLTIPCDTAPTPPPGQSIFCRVRAETDVGGDNNATGWIYTNSSCSTYGSLSGVQNCQINYLQQNICGSWNWSLNNPNDPQCTAALDHYFLQCTSNGLFSAPAALTPTPYWYCNNTSTDRFLAMPCDSAITPANGAAITCRVRPEDAQGTDAHAGDWVTTSAVCPTSTPTPSNTPTNTPTLTPVP